MKVSKKPLLWLLAAVVSFGVAFRFGAVTVHAQSSNTMHFVGEIVTVAFNKGCPIGYVPADGKAYGQFDNISLYGLLGNRFGGDFNNFKVPNLPSQNGLRYCIGADDKILQYPNIP